jgi:hypothetical protein
MNKLKKELEDLKFYLGMARHRRSAMFPGPGIEEDIRLLEKKIKMVEKKLKEKKHGI